MKATASLALFSLERSIRDNGEGIPPADLPRISERFFRVDRAHTRNVPGVGLGLALVAAVARQYNGVLRIASRGRTRRSGGQSGRAYKRNQPCDSCAPSSDYQ